MSDNLPNQNNNLPNPVSGVSNPPNSPTIPNPPNNTVDPVQRWVAQHEQRDTHGRFIPEHEQTPPPTTPNLPNVSNPSYPSQPQVIHTSTKPSGDEPLFEAKVNNPFSSFFNWLKKLIKSEGINIKIKPLTAIGMIAIAGASYGTGYHVGLSDAAKMFFPNSSPILHRAVVYQGVIQKSQSGQYYLSLSDNSLWVLRPTNANINLENVLNKQVTVKGNLTAEPNVINVTEVIAFDKPTSIPLRTVPQTATNSSQPDQK